MGYDLAIFSKIIDKDVGKGRKSPTHQMIVQKTFSYCYQLIC